MKAIVFASILSAISEAHIVKGKIDNKKTPQLDFSQLMISLNNGEYQGSVDQAGAFAVAVPDDEALYKLQVMSHHYYFEPVVVEVTKDPKNSAQPFRAFLFDIVTGKASDINTGRDSVLVYPLDLDASSRVQYFEERQPFDPSQYLKNPFVWMIGLTVVMSQMMKGMDKKDLEEAQKNQKELMGDMPQQCQQQ